MWKVKMPVSAIFHSLNDLILGTTIPIDFCHVFIRSQLPTWRLPNSEESPDKCPYLMIINSGYITEYLHNNPMFLHTTRR